jgi:hypothetical protein
MDAVEFKRRRRRIDWMLTAHSVLRDRYRRRSRALTLLMIASSVAALTLGIVNPDQKVALLGLDGKLQVFLVVFAAITLFLAVVELDVDWQRREWAHDNATRRLGELKAIYSGARRTEAGYEASSADLFAAYDQTMAAIERIPEKHAASLKALHNRKVEVFKRADLHRGAPRWWLRLLVLRDSFRHPERVADPSDDTEVEQ